jgi:RNA polymerase sigma-70 factor (ECF subfamily)
MTLNNSNFNNAKDNEIFKELFHRLYPALRFYAARFLHDDDLDDVIQDAFLELWDKREDIEIGDKIAAFMYRSVYSKSINVLKHKIVENKYSENQVELYNKKMEYFHPDNNEITNSIENTELKNMIYKEISQLPDKCQEIFRMSYLMDMKNKEIAEILNISLRTVEAHIYKALKLLRNNLSKFRILLILFFSITK